VRIYRPDGLGDGAAPTLVFYHGGGFVLGGLLSHDRDCRALANRGQCQVIAVDYRLAPEHPFPAAPEDAIAALEFIVANAGELGVDVDHMAVGGDSAGGNLAAVVALHARDVGIPLRFQLLIYPAVDDDDGGYPSRSENATGYMLDEESITWFTAAYFPDGAPKEWRALPMLAASHEGVAPALVITAEFDPLRDEGEAYATALQAAGVPAKASRYDGMIHGFFGMGSIAPAANAAVEEAGAALRDALHD
jgi:acetyl esterase